MDIWEYIGGLTPEIWGYIGNILINSRLKGAADRELGGDFIEKNQVFDF